MDTTITAQTDLDTLEDSLLEHGLLFLERAAEEVAQANGQTDDPRRLLTFAAMDVAVATELLLKARLAREHWTLVLKDSSKTAATKVRSGDAQTVTPEEALTKLSNLMEISDLPTMEELRRVVRLRNQVAHFHLAKIDDRALTSQVHWGITLLLKLLVIHWANDVTHFAAGSYARVNTILKPVTAITQNRLQEHKEALESANYVLECYTCFQPAMIPSSDGPITCLYCHEGSRANDDPEAIAELWWISIGNPEIYGTGPYDLGRPRECLECTNVAMLQAERPNGPRLWVCFACGMSKDSTNYQLCEICNEQLCNVEKSVCDECFGNHD